MTLVLGVVGHVDHGKTALVRALTGMQTDRLPEEQARGISIALGFAHMRVGAHEVDLIDMPGHERFVRTMVSGATGMDAVLLVIDAREGVMPQTREHVDIAALLGISRAIAVVSRIDVATPAAILAAAHAASALLARAGLRAGPPLPVSARSLLGLDALRQAIAAEAAVPCGRDDEGVPYLAIDRAFSRPGHGTVVTGTLCGGPLSAGDTVQVVPQNFAARIRELQVHGARVVQAQPGQRVAVNLRGVAPDAVGRGTALALPGTLDPSAWLSVQLTAVGDAPVLSTAQSCQLLFGTAEVGARVRLLDRDALRPGETALAQLRCAMPVAVPARARFILRAGAPIRTVAGGIVLDPATARARRNEPTVLDRLTSLAVADSGGIVLGELRRASVAGATLARLARLAGVSASRAAALTAEHGAALGQGETVSRAALDALAAIIPRVLATHPAGVSPDGLRTLVPGASLAVLDAAVSGLLAAGIVVRDGAAIRLRRPDQDRAASDVAAHLSAALADTLRRAGLTPPDPADLAPDLPHRRLLDRLVRDGVVVRAPDRVQRREILFHRDAIEAARLQLACLLAGLLPADGLPVGAIGAALGISRKYSVPLLEYLDSVQFTRRFAERRVLATPP